MRKGIFISTVFIVLLYNTALSKSSVISKIISNTDRTSVYQITKIEGQLTDQKNIFIVNYKEKEPEKIVWIFHGYEPANDIYLQAPSYFIKNWNLEDFAESNKIVFILPEMGTSLYLSNDIEFLQEISKSILTNYPDVIPVVFIGISTGVEGAIKFSPFTKGLESIIAVSGTYNLLSLPKNSGEYLLHQKVFKNDQFLWINENPLTIMKKGKKLMLYLFSEENSIYFKQAEEIKTAGLTGILTNLEITDFFSLGNGYSHGWDFWSNNSVLKKIHEIITK